VNTQTQTNAHYIIIVPECRHLLLHCLSSQQWQQPQVLHDLVQEEAIKMMKTAALQLEWGLLHKLKGLEFNGREGIVSGNLNPRQLILC